MLQVKGAADSGARTNEQMFATMGIEGAAFVFGASEFKRLFSNDPGLEEVGIAFAFAFAHGHAAGIRRAAMVAASPEARGHEAALWGYLLAGDSIDTALARLRAQLGDGTATSSKVVTFPSTHRPPPMGPPG